MGKIVILDESTANKIAAGEVVERPASVVKELMENSIDAGATSISVDIKNGGVSYIKISDNGSGIAGDDVEIAFERHATSKIRSSNDLDSIVTLGFRGEALASIASVSEIELLTRTKDSETGTCIKISGGTVNEVKSAGCPVGTTFTVRDLFYNTPARFKFLKKDYTEAGYISDIISKIALGKPSISIRFSNNGSRVIHTPGNGDLLSAIFSVFGKETSKMVIPVEYNDSRVKVTGFAGKPEIARSSRTSQIFFLNGRYIKSKLISSAADEAYRTILMKNKFPFLVLNVEISPQMVDINVHPAKTEVRFSNEQEIWRSIYHALNNSLSKESLIREVDIKEKSMDTYKFETKKEHEFEQQSINVSRPVTLIRDNQETKMILNENKEAAYQIKESPEIDSEGINYEHLGNKERDVPKSLVPNMELKADNDHTACDYTKNKQQLFEEDVSDNKKSSCFITKNEQSNSLCGIIDNEKDTEKDICVVKKDVCFEKVEPVDSTAKESTIEEIPDIHEDQKEESCLLKDREEIRNEFKDCIVLGQAFSAYILLQCDKGLVLVDQHAAHERIMYERLKKKYENRDSISQSLLSPLVIELTHREVSLLTEKKDLFFSLGFSYDNFGNNSIILRAVPFVAAEGDIKGILLDVLDRVLRSDEHWDGTKADETLYTIACKASVKANARLGATEIDALIRELSYMENPYTCPHGRPTAIVITKNELLKKFKRIL